jgi:hypothetical protein
VKETKAVKITLLKLSVWTLGLLPLFPFADASAHGFSAGVTGWFGATGRE